MPDMENRYGGINVDNGKENRDKEKSLMMTIQEIVRRGNDVEVRRGKDGSLKVFEVKKHIVKAE